ncbi:MAG: OpgC domain-containing protein [Anaerolineae bacterium]
MARAALSPRIPYLDQVAAAISSWRYEPQRRDARFDLLRGYAVFVMIADHVGGDSWLFAITGGNGFFISAAEGFVFIAGLVMGMVYAPIAAKQGVRAVLSKSGRRAVILWLEMVLLTLVFALLSNHEQIWWAPSLTLDDVPGWAWSIISMHRVYFLTDVLVLYTFLIAAAGPLIVLLRRGFTPYVLVGSWAVWALWQVSPDKANLPWTIEDGTLFNLAAWQVLFVTGLVLGYHRKTLERRLTRIPVSLVFLLSGLAVAAAIALYSTHLTPFEGATYYDLLKDQLTGKGDVRLGRLLVFASFATFLFAGVTLLWHPIRRALGWLLLPLGRHSLFAYGSHIFLVLTVVLARSALADHLSDSPQQNALIQVGAILFVWCLVWVRVRLPNAIQPLRESAWTGIRAALRPGAFQMPARGLASSFSRGGRPARWRPARGAMMRTGLLVGAACAVLIIAGDHAALGLSADSIQSAVASASTVANVSPDDAAPAGDSVAASDSAPAATPASPSDSSLRYPVHAHRHHIEAPVAGM